MDLRPFMERWGMVPPSGGTMLVAVSGGRDSVCLLHYLATMPRDFSVAAAHLDHGQRPTAGRDVAFVRQLCASLGVPLHTGGGDVQARAAQTHESLEEAARKLRYAFFDTLPGLVATAHTQDDNLETVLLNLTRGTGLAGLTGIPPKRGRLIRPMLVCTRAQIEAYLAEYPDIALVLDVHRDAIGDESTVYKTCAAGSGMAQVMLVCGTDEYLEHPLWRENLKLALAMQAAAVSANGALMRPIHLASERYNQQYTTGSLIIEVGTNGNTLSEAIAAAELFGRAAGEMLASLAVPG